MNEVVKKILQKNVDFYGKKSVSVSATIDYLHKGFEKERVAAELSERDYNNPDAKYFHMSPEQILESWEEKAKTSRTYGCLLDEYAEIVLEKSEKERQIWLLDHNIDDNIETTSDTRLFKIITGFNQFIKAFTDLGVYEYVGREIPVYYEHNNMCVNGRLDCLFRNKQDGSYIIIDWKTTADIKESNKWQKMLGPCYEFDDATLVHYSIQTGIYKNALAFTYELAPFNNIYTYIVQIGHPVDSEDRFFKVLKNNVTITPELAGQITSFVNKKAALQ